MRAGMNLQKSIGTPSPLIQSVMPRGEVVVDSTESLYRNITLNDVQLASAYYPLLVDLARHKLRLTYGELVDRAKGIYPDKEVVQKAIAVSTGRKLDVVRIFTSQRNLPDLTCLIINKGAGECGVGFTQHFDPGAAREKVFAFDWSNVSTDFDGYIKHTEKVVAPRRRRKRAEALSLMSAYYTANKSVLPAIIRERRDFILELLEGGISEEEAFRLAADESSPTCSNPQLLTLPLSGPRIA